MAKRFKQSAIDAVLHLGEEKEREESADSSTKKESSGGTSTTRTSTSGESTTSSSGKRFKQSALDAIKPRTVNAARNVTQSQDQARRERFSQNHPEYTGGEYGELTRGINSGNVRLSAGKDELERLMEAYKMDPSQKNAAAYNSAYDKFSSELDTFNNYLDQYNAYNSPEGIKKRMDAADEKRTKAQGAFRALSSIEQGNAGAVTDFDDLGYTTSAEALKALRASDAEYKKLLGQFYATENQEQKTALQSESGMDRQYTSAEELQDDMDKVLALMAYVSQGYGDPYAAEEYKVYLGQKYGLDQKAIDQYATAGAAGAYIPRTDGGYNNINELYDELEQKKKQAVTALDEGGYNYKRMSGYDQMLQDAKEYQVKSEDWQRYAEEHPVLSSIGTVIASPFQGLEYLKTMAGGIGTSDESDPYNYVPMNIYDMDVTNFVSQTRGAVSKKIEENTDWDLFGKNVASFLYESGMSIVDSTANLAAFGPTGALLVGGGSAAANQARETILRGGSNAQAFASGLAAGAAEIVFEKISIDNLLAEKTVDGWKSWLKETMKQSGVEASEEMLTEVSNILADAAIMGDNSEYANAVSKYMSQGMSEEKAKQKAFLDSIGQVVEAGVGGALSGGVMGGTVNALNGVANAETNRLVGNDYQVVAEDLVNEGLTFAENTDAYKQAQKLKEKLDAGETLTDSELGRAVFANEQAIQQEEKNAPTMEVSEEENISTLEDAAAAIVKDKTVSRAAPRDMTEQAVKKATGYQDYGVKAVLNIMDSQNMTVDQAKAQFQTAYEAGLTDMPTERANLTTELQRIAFNAGKQDYIMENAGKVERAKTAKVWDSGFDSTNSPADVTDTEIKIVDTLAKALGARVSWADDLKGNAEISSDGTVLLSRQFQRSIGQGEDQKNVSVVYHAVHEIGMHRLMDVAPAEGQAFINALYQDMSVWTPGAATLADGKRAAYAAQDVDISVSGAMEEVAANSILDLYDGNEAEFAAAVERVVNGTDEQAKKGAHKFKEILDGIVKKLREIVAKLTGKERAEANTALESAERLRDLYETALKAGVKNVDSMVELSGAESYNGRGKFSLKEDNGNGQIQNGGVGQGTGKQEIYAGKRSGSEIIHRQTGGRGVLRSDQRYEGINPSFGAAPRYAWASGAAVTPAKGSVTYDAQRTVMEYGIPSFVVSDQAWPKAKVAAPAFSVDGQIYFRETIPEQSRGMLAPHELTHVMRQLNYQPYLDFVQRTPDMLNISDVYTQRLFQSVASHQGIDLADTDPIRLFDEFNATMYGHIAAGKAEMFSSGEGSHVFNDFSAYANALRGIHEQFKAENVKAMSEQAQKNTTQEDGVRYSINEAFASDIDAWDRDGRKDGETFILGSTGPVLQGLGAIESDIYMNADKINDILKKHPEMTLNEIKRIPEMLEDPVLILKSRNVGRGGNQNTRMIIFGSIKAQNGKPVLSVLDLRPHKSNLVISDMQKVTSAYTKDGDPVGFIKSSYVMHADKKRTAPLLRSIGFQMPIELLRSGSMGSVTYYQRSVNLKGEPFNNVVRENGGAKFSLKDSDGRTLSPGQQEYFKDSKVVDKDGNLKVMYHGTASDFTVFDPFFAGGKNGTAEGYGLYFADTPKVSDAYGGKLMIGYLNITHPATSYNKTIKQSALVKLIKATCAEQAKQSVADGEYDSIRDALRDTWVSNYVYTYDMTMDAAYREVANSIISMSDNDMAIIQEVMSGNAIRSYEEAYKFYDILKATMGIDGFITEWNAKELDGGKAQIALAFDSNQFKNTDNLNPTSNPDTRFSLKEHGNLLRENAKLKETVDGLRSQLRLTTFAKVDKRAMDAYTKKLLKDYSSGADINDTRDALTAVYDYMANGEDGNAPAWNEVYKRAYEAAVGILENASTIDDTLYQEYKSLRDELKTRAMKLSPNYENDLMGFEGLRDFKRTYSGRLKLSNDGTPVDVVYADLAMRYPEFFDDDTTNQADQLLKIGEVLDSLRPAEHNPYSYNMRESATWLANDIIERFYSLPQAKPTYADKASRRLDRVRAQKNQKIQQIIEENREKVKSVTAKERAKRTEAVEKVKEHYLAKESRTSDRRKASMWRNKINKHVSNISKMLNNPTETSHVPQAMRQTVAEFLSVLDLTTERQKEKTINRLTDLRTLYKSIADNETDLDIVVDPDLDANMDAVLSALRQGGDTVTVADLSNRDLESLYRVTLAVERSIYSYNRAMVEGKKERISDLAHSVMIQNSTTKAYREHNRAVQWAADTVNMDMLNPQDYFLQLGDTMSGMYQSIRDGFDTKIRLTSEAKKYMEKLKGDMDLKPLSDRKAVAQEFKVQGGQTIRLTPAQVMSLYLLNRQPDAHDHIYKGGIKPAPTVARQGKDKRPKVTRSYDVVKVTPEDVAKILESMTPEQKKLAEGIGQFFTEHTAEWGNEVSLALYGYKKFTVENYFPIVSDRNYLKDVFGETTDATLKNMGSTKARIKGASNPIIIEDVLDVFTRQVDQMSSYNAFVIPLTDIQRVFNFKTNSGSVKQSIEKRYGVRATQYFKKLMTDINGGGRWNGGSQFMSEMISKYKQAKMGLNLRVALQQPSAIMRAGAVIDAKYLAQAMTHRSSADTETIYKYAPISEWKAWGYFSMDTGKQMKDVILDNKKLADYTMALAGKMDEITWKRLWVAAELETRDKRSDLEVGSDEYYTIVGKRFSEIIDRTQVVDSVLHRSQLMRNPDTLVKMSVSFMNEPFKAYNMLRTAIVEAKRNPTSAAKKAVAGSVVAYLSSLVVNHLITALVDTLRGDEDDEEWLEKMWNKITGKSDEELETKTWWQRYLWHFADNLVNEPLSMFPFVKDVVSMVQGYDIKRMDLQGVGDLVNAITRGLSDKYTIQKKVVDIGSKAGDLFGIPVSSLKREVETVVKLVVSATDSPVVEYKVDKALYNVEANKGRFIDILYSAYKQGDTESYNIIVQDMIDRGIDATTIENGLRSRFKKEFGEVDIPSEFALSVGIKPKKFTEEKEEKFDVNDLTSAQYTQYMDARGEMINGIIEDFKRMGYGDLDEETASELLGAAWKLAEETALENASGGKYQSDTKWIDKAQNADDLGLTTAEYIMLMVEYSAQSIGADGVYDAYSAGIDVSQYLEVRDNTKDLKADKDEDGNPIPGSKKEKVTEYLDTIDLTDEEYEAYLELFGYSTESSGFGSGFGSGSKFGK